MKIRELLQEMVDQNASDIFIVAGLPLTYQVEGRQVRWDAPLMPADTSEVVHAIYGLAGRDINVGSSRVDLQACKLEYSIVSPK